MKLVYKAQFGRVQSGRVIRETPEGFRVITGVVDGRGYVTVFFIEKVHTYSGNGTYSDNRLTRKIFNTEKTFTNRIDAKLYAHSQIENEIEHLNNKINRMNKKASDVDNFNG